MAWVETSGLGAEERVYLRSEAVMRLGRYLGFPWRLVTLARLVPASVRDRLYDWVATRRRRWFQSATACSIASADHRRLL